MKFIMYNPIISVGLISWLTAQILKTIHYSIKFKSFNPERLTGAGGMPSSHSSLVVSVMIYTLRLKGFSSSEFAFAVLIAGIVIYDAMSVRYNAGLHAKELNKLRRIVDELDDEITALSGSDDDSDIDEIVNQKDLKEFLGHTPIEVLAGSLLGILIAMAFPVPV
ncbi:MAG: divergent PAP2 family protein [Oscillospiraceae bacterium]|nr:divergent PAP2 family protein [Oscillospiraceae bacterium]